MNLQGKHVLITGGSSGIGAALAGALHGRGCSVTALDLRLPRKPVEGVQYVRADITKSEEIERAMGALPSPIDILVTNAGVMRRGTIFQTSEEDFDLLFDVHVKGTWTTIKHAQSHCVKKPTIVHISSRHAETLPENPAVYGLSKRAAEDLLKNVQETFPSYDVRIVRLGPVETPLTHEEETAEGMRKKAPLLRAPEEIATLIVDLLEKDHRELLFEGESNAYRFR